jgi:pimeloyl-ACP methyl ester carboxylesterase
MLLIHGLVGSSENWCENIGVLAQHASVYAVDMLNNGRSQRIAGLDASLEATADRLAAAMTALGLADADIVAHSHGGAVALMLAARHPDRVRSLILYAPANPFSDSSNFLVRVYSTWFGSLIASCAPYLPSPMQQFALGRMYGDPARIPDGCLQGYVKDLRVRGTVPHILAIVRCWFATMARLQAVLPSVAEVPTLLVWGDRDRAVSLDSGTKLNRELPSSQLVVVPGGGHVLFQEMPEESNYIMLEWLSRDQISAPLPVAPRKPATHNRELPRPTSIAARTASAMRRLSPEI